jgi:hypothetical protein
VRLGATEKEVEDRMNRIDRMQKASALPQKNPVHPAQKMPELSEIIMEINDLRQFGRPLRGLNARQDEALPGPNRQ